ncbi:MAG: hypothetical protein WBA89_05665 [Microcoleus sp.]|uniref:hypothetical protein n=1 Tax=Microcoleus sp. TaxID=44472 RepID=UPI003C74FF36
MIVARASSKTTIPQPDNSKKPALSVWVIAKIRFLMLMRDGEVKPQAAANSKKNIGLLPDQTPNLRPKYRSTRFFPQTSGFKSAIFLRKPDFCVSD